MVLMQYEAPTIIVVEVKQEQSFCSPIPTPGSSSLDVTFGQEDW